MKVSELSGVMLDLWVAKADGATIVKQPVDGERLGKAWIAGEGDEQCVVRWGPNTYGRFDPSICWQGGGPIIERERIGIIPVGAEWKGYGILDMDASAIADEPLVAAMRAFVASKFGDEVEEPQ